MCKKLRYDGIMDGFANFSSMFEEPCSECSDFSVGFRTYCKYVYGPSGKKIYMTGWRPLYIAWVDAMGWVFVFATF